MAYVNEWHGIGNLTKDPEVKTVNGGNKVAKFSIALNKNYTTKAGEKKEETYYINMVAWSKMADISEKFLHQGKQAFFQGELTNRSWDNEDGTKGYITEIVLQKITLLGGKRKEETNDNFLP